MDIRESLNDQIYITTFKDPTVALETTQSNQTYSYKQKNETHGDVQDQRNLSPDWNPNYFYRQEKGLTYVSTDQLDWNLLNPTRIEELIFTPDQFNQSTTLVNDFLPTSRSRYQKAVVQTPRSTLETTVGKAMPYSSWSLLNRNKE
jgi:hypothetical protein